MKLTKGIPGLTPSMLLDATKGVQLAFLVVAAPRALLLVMAGSVMVLFAAGCGGDPQSFLPDAPTARPIDAAIAMPDAPAPAADARPDATPSVPDASPAMADANLPDASPVDAAASDAAGSLGLIWDRGNWDQANWQ